MYHPPCVQVFMDSARHLTGKILPEANLHHSATIGSAQGSTFFFNSTIEFSISDKGAKWVADTSSCERRGTM